MAGNIKSCVVDASFVLSYLFPSEKTAFVDKVLNDCLDGKIRLVSIELLPLEVLNGIRGAIIKKRLETDSAIKLVEAFFQIDITYEESDFSQAFTLAVKKNLTVYDASYLSLSLAKHLPLLTMDKVLKRSAKD